VSAWMFPEAEGAGSERGLQHDALAIALRSGVQEADEPRRRRANKYERTDSSVLDSSRWGLTKRGSRCLSVLTGTLGSRFLRNLQGLHAKRRSGAGRPRVKPWERCEKCASSYQHDESHD